MVGSPGHDPAGGIGPSTTLQGRTGRHVRSGPEMTADLAELGVLADENLAQSRSTFGRSSGASLGRSDRCSFVATGVPMAFFNGEFAAGPVADCEPVVDDAIIFMAEHDVPFLLWVREGVDDELLDAGRRAGLRDSGGPPAMVLPSIPPSPPPPELEFTVVADVEGVAVCRHVVHRGLEMPSEIADTLFLDGIIDSDPITIVVGSVGDTPVACASVVVTGTTAVAIEPARWCSDDGEPVLHTLEVDVRRKAHLVAEPGGLARCDLFEHPGLCRSDVEGHEWSVGLLGDRRRIRPGGVAQDRSRSPFVTHHVHERNSGGCA